MAKISWIQSTNASERTGKALNYLIFRLLRNLGQSRYENKGLIFDLFLVWVPDSQFKKKAPRSTSRPIVRTFNANSPNVFGFLILNSKKSTEIDLPADRSYVQRQFAECLSNTLVNRGVGAW